MTKNVYIEWLEERRAHIRMPSQRDLERQIWVDNYGGIAFENELIVICVEFSAP